jgi:tetratricopeptide (TPR) repeat protein
MRHLLIIFFIGISISSFAQETIESLFKKGEQAFKEGNYELTVDYFSKCISKNRNLMEAYWYRGLAYLNQNSTQEALMDINKALELSKSSDKDSQQSLYSIRAQIYTKTNNYKDAINDYSKALSINPENLGNYWSRALCYYHIEEYNKALKDFVECEKLIDVNDKDNLTKLI